MNIVVVAIDSLRADHLRCYGYGKPTSPHIDAVARESVVFDQAITAGIPTMPSFTTLYTGLHPYRHGIVAHIGRRHLAEGIFMLPQLLKQHGYVTAACDNLVVQGDGRGDWFARGYDHYAGFLYRPFTDQSTWITDRALRFVEEYAGDGGAREGERPLFLFVHYWDPHSPYGPQPPFDTLHYEPGSGPVDMADIRAIYPDYYDGFLETFKLRHPDDYAYVVAQYDGEIGQVDAQVGRLVDALKAQGCWDDTLFVVLSDHGECFGEGEFYFDHHGLYDAVTRVALMLHVPGQAPGRRSALVSTEDILPTLADLVGFALPSYSLSGASFRPLMEDPTHVVRDEVISVESTRQASLAFRTADWKLILPIVEDAEGRDIPDFYGRPRSPKPLLFDLQRDPMEQHNLQAERPSVRDTMLCRLAEWRVEMERVTGERDPVRAQGLTLPYERFVERLFSKR